MSKMSQLAMELDEQAYDLGFESYLEALDNGFEVRDGKLIKSDPKTPENTLKMRNTGYFERDWEFELACKEWEYAKLEQEIAELKQIIKEKEGVKLK